MIYRRWAEESKARASGKTEMIARLQCLEQQADSDAAKNGEESGKRQKPSGRAGERGHSKKQENGSPSSGAQTVHQPAGGKWQRKRQVQQVEERFGHISRPATIGGGSMAKLCSRTVRMMAASDTSAGEDWSPKPDFRRTWARISRGWMLSSRKNAPRGKSSARWERAKPARPSAMAAAAPWLHFSSAFHAARRSMATRARAVARISGIAVLAMGRKEGIATRSRAPTIACRRSTEPKGQRSHGQDCDPGQHQLRKMSHPLVRAAQNRGHKHITHQRVSRRQSVRFRTIESAVPANTEIHRMHRVLDDLLRHCEEVRIVDNERLVQVWQQGKRLQEAMRETRRPAPRMLRSVRECGPIPPSLQFPNFLRRFIFMICFHMQWAGG